MVEIGGIVKFTLIDYPGHAACTIFLQGCNFRCRYCQNVDLIEKRKGNMSIETVLEFLDNRKEYLDAVVISGGEPLIHEDLHDFIKEIKVRGFKVKLDTNGYLYQRLKDVLPHVDYVAMDIKAKKEKYSDVVGVNINFENILKSIEIIKTYAKDYEFRTTVVPGLVEEEDVEEIAKTISGSKLYVIQNFNNRRTLDEKLMKRNPFDYTKMRKFKEIAEKYLSNVKLRNI